MHLYRPPEIGVTELELKEIHVGEVPAKWVKYETLLEILYVGVSESQRSPLKVNLLGKIMFSLLISHHSTLPTCWVQFETLLIFSNYGLNFI